MRNNKYPFIVIGGGISGMTAAIYLKRAGYDVMILEREIPGGQINRTAEIDNYPGFLTIDGPSLAMNVYQQTQKLNIPMVFEDVLNINKDQEIKIMTKQNEYICDRLIIATGRMPRKLELRDEEKYIGHGISYCALCDGAFFKDKTVAVIGSGNSALEEALYLTKLCKKIIMINRSEKFKGSKILYEKLKASPNVQFLYQTHVVGILGNEEKITGIEVMQEEKKSILQLDGLFVYIGSIPNTSFLKNIDIHLDQGFIVTDQNMHTNIEGIYACGDCVKKEVYQLTTAVGDGATAATTAEKEL